MAEERDHAIYVYQVGKFIGYLTSKGGTNRLKVHAVQVTKAKGKEVAQEITDGDNPYTAEAKPLYPKKKGAR